MNRVLLVHFVDVLFEVVGGKVVIDHALIDSLLEIVHEISVVHLLNLREDVAGERVGLRLQLGELLGFNLRLKLLFDDGGQVILRIAEVANVDCFGLRDEGHGYLRGDLRGLAWTVRTRITRRERILHHLFTVSSQLTELQVRIERSHLVILFLDVGIYRLILDGVFRRCLLHHLIIKSLIFIRGLKDRVIILCVIRQLIVSVLLVAFLVVFVLLFFLILLVSRSLLLLVSIFLFLLFIRRSLILVVVIVDVLIITLVSFVSDLVGGALRLLLTAISSLVQELRRTSAILANVILFILLVVIVHIMQTNDEIIKR